MMAKQTFWSFWWEGGGEFKALTNPWTVCVDRACKTLNSLKPVDMMERLVVKFIPKK
jgi:hypothetical protein